MDPLSITASVLTCVGATIKAADTVLTLIDRIKNAPNEVLAIYNDVTDLKVVLTEIQLNAAEERNLWTSSRQVPDGSPAAPAIIEAKALVTKRQIRLHEI